MGIHAALKEFLKFAADPRRPAGQLPQKDPALGVFTFESADE